MGNRVLVVDSDPRSLRVLDVSLRGAGFEVETATSGTEAWARLSDAPPDLVIADTVLEGMDGFELCARLRRTPAGAAIPFLFLAADPTLDQKIRGLEAGADDYLVKPAYTKEVLAHVGARLQRRARDRLLASPAGGTTAAAASAFPELFTGDLSEIAVVDLVQLVEGTGRSGAIHIHHPDGRAGDIYFRRNRVVDAEVGSLSGMDAVARLFSWTRGAFEIEWKAIRRKDVIERSAAAVIIEGMQQLDEQNQLRATLADPHALFEVDYQALAERLAEIPDEMNTVLKLCEGARTVRQIVEDGSLSDVEALTALIRLRDEGIIREVSGASGSGRVAAAVGGASGGGSAGGAGIRRVAHAHGTAGVTAERRSPPAPGGGGLSPPSGPATEQPPRRRTAPGLGQDLALSPVISGIEARPDEGAPPLWPDPASAPVETGSGRIIPFPRTPHSEGLGDGGEQDPQPLASLLGDDLDVPSAKIGIPASVPAEDRAGDQVWSGSVVPPSPSSPSPHGPRAGAPTQRGFDLGHLRPAAPLPDAGAGVGEDAILAGAHAAVSDATTRIRYRDDEITDHDAIDELGLPSRWRVVRFLAVALVVGGLALMVAQRFRGGGITAGTGGGGGQPSGAAATRAPALAAQATPPDNAAAVAPMPAAPSPSPSAAEPSPAPRPPDVPERSPGGGEGTLVKSASSPVDGVAAAPPVALPGGAAPGVAAAPGSTPAPAPDVAGASGAASGTDAPSVAAAKPDAAGALARCRVAFSHNREREAIAACNAAVAANPRSADALTMLAHAELNRGRLDRAGGLASQALTIDPSIADAYVIIGGVRQDSGQNAEAKAAYRRYLQLAPHGRYADELRSIVNGL